MGSKDVGLSLPATLHEWRSIKSTDDAPQIWEPLRPFFLDRGYDLYVPKEGHTFGHPRVDAPVAENSFGYNNGNIPYNSTFFIRGGCTAARDSYNHDVVIKVVAKGESNELTILRKLNSEPLRSDPRNASLFVIDFLTYADWHFIVLPMCRQGLTVPMSTIHEILQFAEQLTDALAFLHEHGIAHLDICGPNTLINYRGKESQYVPIPFPGRECLPSWQFRYGFPAKYYLIDFDASVFFPGFVGSRVRGRYWADPFPNARPHRAPEMDGLRKIDPFSADVYQTGKLFYGEYYIMLHQMPGFLEIIQAMTFKYPPHRISMGEACFRIRALRSAFDDAALSRLYDLFDVHLLYGAEVPRPSWRRHIDSLLFWLWNRRLI